MNDNKVNSTQLKKQLIIYIPPAYDDVKINLNQNEKFSDWL